MHGAHCTITCSDRSLTNPRPRSRSAAHRIAPPAVRRRRAATRVTPAATRRRPGRGAARDLQRHPLSRPEAGQRKPLHKRFGCLSMSSLAIPASATAESWVQNPFGTSRLTGIYQLVVVWLDSAPHFRGRPASPPWRSYGTDLSSRIRGFLRWSERRCPSTRAVPTTARTTAPALSSTRERPA
jgi:hypothetical protein